ncbi:MAG: TolC family protein [Bacteroidota bacterium]
MKGCKSTLYGLLLILLTSFSNEVHAQGQESLINEISVLYLNKLIAVAKENYPQVKSVNKQVDMAKNDLTLAKISWLEPISFSYAARSNTPNTNGLVDVTTADLLTGYQFGIAINPSSLFTKPTTIRKARSQIEIAENARDQYNLSLERNVKDLYFNYLLAEKGLSLANVSYVNAQANFNVTKLAYQKAEITLLEYNSGSMTYNQAINSKMQAEVAFLSAKAALEELTVKKLEEIK